MGESVHSHLHQGPNSFNSLFSNVYKNYHLQMLRIARYYLSDYVLAEDVVSDIFAKLWEMRLDLKSVKDLKSYLFVMVKRKCLDEANRHSYKKRQSLEEISPRYFVNFKGPETTFLNKELGERIAISLQKLPDKCRTVFLLVKEDKLKYKEVAQILNISEKTVEMHVGNALKALRKDLEAYAIPSAKSKRLTHALNTVKSLMFSLM